MSTTCSPRKSMTMPKSQPPSSSGIRLSDASLNASRHIVHDLLNNLGVIQGFAQLTQLGDPLDNAAAENVASIRKMADHAVSLCQELQSLLHGNGQPERRSPICLNGLLNDLRGTVAVSSHGAPLMVFDLHENLPRLLANPTQLREMVLELIQNAWNAIREAEESRGAANDAVTVRTGFHDDVESRSSQAVVLGERTSEHAIFLEVGDSGCGMTAEALRQFMHPGYTTKANGQGLGLSSVLRIVRQHGGMLIVNSEPNRGTTIRCTFPYAPNQEHVENNAPPMTTDA